MATVRLSDVIVPDTFTPYVVQNTLEKTALVQSGVAVRNGEIDTQLRAGSDQFTIPFWNDLANDEADIVNDDPAVMSTPKKLNTGMQEVRKSYLHQSWSAMNLASELAGANAMEAIERRVTAYWERQMQRRLISTLNGVLADNVANNGGDMVHDISALTGGSEKFRAEAVIRTAGTLGDAMRDLRAIAMHSDTFEHAMINDLIATEKQSDGSMIQTFRGLAIIVDDSMPVTTGVYTSVLFGQGAIGYGMAEPSVAAGTEVENVPGAGNGGGQQILHSRVNLAIHPAGYRWTQGSVVGQSPTVAELALDLNWSRVVERKAIPLAFLKHKL